MIRSIEDDKNREQYIDGFFELDSTLKQLQSQIEVMRQIRRNDSVSMYVLRLAHQKSLENEQAIQQDVRLCDQQRQNDQLIIQTLKSKNNTLKWGGGILLVLSIGSHFMK